MIVDYHMHTPLCKHAVGEPEAYALRAIERGIEEIGFSDHCPMPPDYDPDWRMASSEYPAYIEMVRRCQKAFPQLSIKLGLEADYHPGTEDFVRSVISAHPIPPATWRETLPWGARSTTPSGSHPGFRQGEVCPCAAIPAQDSRARYPRRRYRSP